MKAFDFQPEFRKTTLKNGVRVLTEHHPYTRATCAGVYLDLGTRDEPSHLLGAAHFIEHLVFKGTRTRSGLELVRSLEAVGGEINAFTSRENTCFHTTTLREHLPIGIDILCDIVNNAKFTASDYEKERQVVLQEIDMSADLFEEYVFDLYFEQAYHRHTLGRPILGTPESLAGMSRKKVFDFYHEQYKGKNLVVSVAGDVDHDFVVKEVQKRLGKRQSGTSRKSRRKPKVKSFHKTYQRSSEQVHLLMGFPSCSFKSPFRFAAYIINALLGGGMTSLLYQKIREKRGLAYSVYSYLHSFTDSGLIMVYAGTSEEYLKKVFDLIYSEAQRLRDRGITASQLKFFKTQVKGSILLAADDIENRMNSLAINELVFGSYRSVDKVVEEIDSVTVDSVKEYLEQYFDLDRLGCIVLGDVSESKVEKDLFLPLR